MPSVGSYVAPAMPSYGMSSYAAPAVHAPMVSSSISAPVAGSVSVPTGSISAPMTLPTSNMFSGYTSTPFMPASYYNPSTFGAPTTTMGGMSLPTPMASSVSSLPLGTYGAGSFGAMTSIPRATYAPTSYGTTYGGYGASYGSTYASPTTTYAAPTTTYVGGSTPT